MVEIYKDMVGYEDYFKVSNLGNIYSKRTEKVIKQVQNKNGYMQVSTRIGGRMGRSILLKVHRVVAEAHLVHPSEQLVLNAKKTKYGKVPVNHKDGNKNNNKADNLEWCTYQGNTMHAINNGLRVYPEMQHGSVLSSFMREKPRHSCRGGCQTKRDAGAIYVVVTTQKQEKVSTCGQENNSAPH